MAELTNPHVINVVKRQQIWTKSAIGRYGTYGCDGQVSTNHWQYSVQALVQHFFMKKNVCSYFSVESNTTEINRKHKDQTLTLKNTLEVK